MKTILLFGAGKSASVLIEYLLENAAANDWCLVVADTDKSLIELKTKLHPASFAVAADITDQEVRRTLIVDSDLVISMMPPLLHILIAKDCVLYAKHLLTASYADDAMKELAEEASNKGIIFLCEMGLDPGIDHMSAMELIHDIKAKGGLIHSFQSHCGGLVSPESDDNPWRYKISWNPRNVVLAGKAGAEYIDNGKQVKEEYEDLFNPERQIATVDDNIGALSYYPNRNSLPYIDLYDLHETKTFIRTTLRYPEFITGWRSIISLKLTDEVAVYESDGISLAEFFKAHFEKHGYTDRVYDQRGTLAGSQLCFLGTQDLQTVINKGLISAADGLQFALEKKLLLSPEDKDMIVMQHELEYEVNGENKTLISSLIVKGRDNIHTAMAKTVGLPLGIAAKLILNKTIKLSGLHLPIIKEIYEPVLRELAENGINFQTRNS